MQSLKNGPPHHLRGGRRVHQESPIISAMPGLCKNMRSLQTLRHGPQATYLPPKPYPWIGQPCNGPGNVRINQTNYALCNCS